MKLNKGQKLSLILCVLGYLFIAFYLVYLGPKRGEMSLVPLLVTINACNALFYSEFKGEKSFTYLSIFGFIASITLFVLYSKGLGFVGARKLTDDEFLISILSLGLSIYILYRGIKKDKK